MTSQHQDGEARPMAPKPVREVPGLGRRVSQALVGLKACEAELARGAEPTTTCGAVARVIGEFLTADVVVIASYASDSDQSLPVAAFASEARRISPRQVNLQLAASALRAVPAGSLLRFDTDVETEQLTEAERWHLQELGVAQVIVAPLVRRHRLLGRIDIMLVEPALFSQVEIDLCVQMAGQAATALALARVDSAEAEAGRAEVMLKVSEALRSAQPGSPSELLQVVVSLLPKVLECDRCYAYMWDGERNAFLPTAVSGMVGEQVTTLKQYPMSPAEIPLFEQAMYSTRPIAIDNARTSTMLQPELVHLLGTQALLALPLRGRRQEAVGVLILDHQSPGRTFDSSQIALAARLAEQVSAMVETASLYEEVSRRSDRLAVLNEIGLDLASLTDLPTVFPALHSKLATVIDATALLCAVLEPTTGRLTIYHMVGAALSVAEGVDAASSPLLAQVFGDGQGLVRQSGAMELMHGLHDNAGDGLPESLICVPMRVRGQEVIGALAAYSSYQHAYSQQDLELVSTVASQIAVAVENAQLYAQVHARGELRGQLLDRIMSAHELERKSIVDDIHDDSLQAMVSSMYKIDLCLRLSETQNHQQELEELRNVRANLAANVDRLRSLIFEIRPSTLDYLGLLPTLDDYLARMEETTGIVPTFRSEIGARLDIGLETLIYRLIQELLANVGRHSRATKVLIELKRVSLGVQVVVQDNGIGFNTDEVIGRGVPNRGIGLFSVRERVQVAGGVCTIESRSGAGTRVQVVLPMNAGQHITGPLDESRLRDSSGLAGGL